MKRTAVRIIVTCLPLLTCACNLFLPWAFILPDTRKVAPEFAKLANHKVAVLVWAEPETLYDYPYVRLETASHIGDKIRAEVEGVQLVNARKIEDFLQRDPDAAVDPELIGEHFQADMVVYVELLEFQIRDPESPDLLQAKVRATVQVHDLTADADEGGIQELDPVSVTYPDQAILYSMTAPVIIRNETYIVFAELVARKFYEHKEKL